jgi:hypothetical protein
MGSGIMLKAAFGIRILNPISFILLKKHINVIVQGWPRQTPRAIFGPLGLFNGPWRHFETNRTKSFLLNLY